MAKSILFTAVMLVSVSGASMLANASSIDVGNNPTDITNKHLTSQSAGCENYVGAYSSHITDVQTGNEYHGALVITAAKDSCTIYTNQIPNHDTGKDSRFRGAIAENDTSLQIARHPSLAVNSTELAMGANAILLNGIKWEAFPAACFDVGNEPIGREAIGCHGNDMDNPWRYNIGSELNYFGFDNYGAHLQPGGMYHYHSTPTVLFDVDCDTAGESPVVGFASDGFPIFGSCFTQEDGQVRKATSSFQLKLGERQSIGDYTTPYKVGNVASNNYDGQFIGDYEYVAGSGDLDACNGMVVDGQYGYYVTESYPYVLACTSGTPSRNFR